MNFFWQIQPDKLCYESTNTKKALPGTVQSSDCMILLVSDVVEPWKNERRSQVNRLKKAD